MKTTTNLLLVFALAGTIVFAQNNKSTDPIVDGIVKEATENSQLKELGFHLLDVIGPRLVGTPEMKQSHDWIIKTYQEWGIEAENQQWGEWRGWQRGHSHISMVSPRIQSLDGTQLAWNPSTSAEGVTAEIAILPLVKDSTEFANWLTTVKGKIILVSQKQESGRPDYNWEKWATPESFEKMKEERKTARKKWRTNLKNTGFSSRSIIPALEEAGASGIVSSYWSDGFGVNKIFSARTKSIPQVDMELEDYTMLYRLAEHSVKTEINIVADSKEMGRVPTFNSVGRIEGTEFPNEYIILSAHLDSWDGGTGATDNGTGTLVMMEAMRLLKKMYPNPKRTILAGHWGSEEQGLNGSRAFVEDHPEIVSNIQAVFNQDNGTGRAISIKGAGFIHSYKYITDWLSAVPRDISKHIETSFPGSPSGGGSDNVSFVAAGVPAFNLYALSWDYWNYTWHTNRDTYDKIVWDDVQNNAILAAIMAYKASEDDSKTSRERIVLPINKRSGKQRVWPKQKSPKRDGGK